MDNLDLQVLATARDWVVDGRAVWLVSVIETWGSAPRPVGALLAVRDDGQVAGSVSGGCVEDDLIDRVRGGERPDRPAFVTYGVGKDEAARFGLPCGGTLRLLQEPLRDTGWVDDVLARVAEHRLTVRQLDLETGAVSVSDATPSDAFRCDASALTTVYGPRWRLLLIGAGQLSRVLAQMALTLDFDVLCCDPREEYGVAWDVPGTRFTRAMPDDAVVELHPDVHTAIVALTHDPKLDDLALIDALASPAFYVGALGSARSTAQRRSRLATFGLDPAQLARLHGPVGLPIGSRTPAEIAVSVLAEIVAVRSGAAAARHDRADVATDDRPAASQARHAVAS